MQLRISAFLLCALVMLTAVPALAAAPTAPVNKFKLKNGGGAVCIECHSGDFDALLKKPFVHSPVRARDCVACHSPHAASHTKLLSDDPGKICSTCHSVVPEKPKSAHKPVANGGCLTCHDAHASEFKYNLVKEQRELCGGCHKPVLEAATKARFKHKPVEQGCATCHDPHGSATAGKLLKTDVPELCVGCHKMDRPVLVSKHMGYPVAKARCTSCHDPHGSNMRGMLYDNVHPPVARGMCAQCHEPARPGGPVLTRQTGMALCKTCHADKVNAMLGQSRVHWAVLEGDSCLTCHSPHAARQKALVKGNMVNVCGQCHADTIRRQEASETKHKPIAEGQCTACHDPHGSSAPLNFVKADVLDLCGSCHDWHKHSTHPIGEKVKDPRNPNLTVSCLSCHRAHGTEYKHLRPYATTTDLCTKCHTQFKR